MLLFFKNLFFTILVPGTVAFYVPLWIVSGPAAGHEHMDFASVFLVGRGSLLVPGSGADLSTHGRNARPTVRNGYLYRE